MRESRSLVHRVYVAAAISAAGASAAAAAELSDDSDVISEIVVTGTRVADRSRLDTLAPVDMLPAETLARSGTTELAQALSELAPSLNFPRPAITDGTDHIRPAALRGLAPDQTLVLVNSKRRHPSALVNVNTSVGRGSAAVDLNAIPWPRSNVWKCCATAHPHSMVPTPLAALSISSSGKRAQEAVQVSLTVNTRPTSKLLAASGAKATVQRSRALHGPACRWAQTVS